VLKVAKGRVAVLTCRVFGAPRPTIYWQKGKDRVDVEDFHDPRITVLDIGDLEIQVCLYCAFICVYHFGFCLVVIVFYDGLSSQKENRW